MASIKLSTGIDLSKCIVCQKISDNRGCKKLTSTESGREKLFQCSEILNDNLFQGLDQEKQETIKYHVNTCYQRYVRDAQRTEEHKQNVAQEYQINNENNESKNYEEDTARKSKRRKSEEIEKPTLCIVCNQKKCKGDTNLYRISAFKRAKQLLLSTKYFKDEVYTRCILLESPGDVFAADIMYHNNCLSSYILKFKRDIEMMTAENEDDLSQEADTLIDDFIGNLQIMDNAYSISNVRDDINKTLKANKIDHELSNKNLKNRIVKRFGEEVCFSYPKDKRKSAMFFSNSIKTSEVVSTIHSQDSIRICAQALKRECQDYSFKIESSNKSAKDLAVSLDSFKTEELCAWNKFFKEMFPFREQSEQIQRKCDTIFQIFYNLVHNSAKVSPQSILVAQAVHDLTRSKKLIDMLHRLGICINYKSLLKIDLVAANCIIRKTGTNRVPVGDPILPSAIIHGAMDNFDHEENTLSGIGGSHDTILMLFQNREETENDADDETTAPVVSTIHQNENLLNHVLPCQTISKATNMGKRGEIAADFLTGDFNDNLANITKDQFKIWSAARSKNFGQQDGNGVPSFVATNSLFADPIDAITKFSFTPIIPYPATEYDTIFTCMKNFQDVLKQRNQDYGPIWCDEGVYRIGKELQLLNPEQFDNIFLGLGGFHMEKVLIACCGVYLKETGINTVFVENEVYGPGVVQSVMSGSNYNRGKRGMMIISEVLQQLQLEAFTLSWVFDDQYNAKEVLKTFQEIVKCEDVHRTWKHFEEKLADFLTSYNHFIKQGCSSNNEFKFWNVFLNDIVPVLIDLNRSHREGNWELHLSAVRRALPLFFAFNRSNYRRWAPLYFEDCLSVETKFPKLYDCFINGGFVVAQTKRRGSQLPMDQALEKQYNKPAKSSSGIIGYTRRKEAVCKWNLIKHEKSQYTSLLEKVCDLTIDDEYAIHHEFSESRTKEDVSSVQKMVEYINNRGNPFTDIQEMARNFATGKQIEGPLAEHMMKCVEIGEKEYAGFKEERLQKKTVKLFDTITNVKHMSLNPKPSKKVLDVKKETLTFLRVIEIARIREYDLATLLQYEITSTSFFLEKDGTLRKSPKFEFAKELKGNLEIIPESVPDTGLSSAIVFDFMAYCRKVPIKKMKLCTFEDLFKSLWSTFQHLSSKSQRLDIVFDIYLENSVKQQERDRRGKKQVTETIITNVQQALPVEIQSFWGSSSNKMQLQQCFINWMQNTYKDQKPVFLGGAIKEDITSCYQLQNSITTIQNSLKCMHEEADDRMMFHINHAIQIGSFRKIIVASPDTDVFVNLVHHFTKWQFRDLEELWILSGKKSNPQAVPIHELVTHLDQTVIDVLPAVHALTGCDTTSKVGTKKMALQVTLNHGFELLHSFGKEPITESMISQAEEFLVHCTSSKSNLRRFDDLRYEHYYQKTLTLDLEKLPPTSNSIRLHIRRSYFQTYLWIHSPIIDSIDLRPEDYGYILIDEEDLLPQVTVEEALPGDFLMPCSCIKCAKKNVCPCRVNDMPCCDFCKCRSGDFCQNQL